MTETLWQVLGGLLLLVGFIGCVVPVLPGPVLAYGAIWCLLPTAHAPSTSALVALGALVAVVTVADYIVPSMGAKRFDCSRWGTFGCFAGTLVGAFFFPLGLLLGPFLGAVLGELVAGRALDRAVRCGFGALLGFLSGVVLKLTACALLAVCFVRCLRT